MTVNHENIRQLKFVHMKSGLPHPDAIECDTEFNKCGLAIQFYGVHIYGKHVVFHYLLPELQRRYVEVLDWKTGEIKMVSFLLFPFS